MKVFILLTAVVTIVAATNQLTIDEIINKAQIIANGSSLAPSYDEGILRESDVLYTKEQWARIQASRRDSNSPVKRKGVRELQDLWSNGVIPYIITDVFTDNDKKVILQALDRWSKVACLKFREARGNESSVKFVDGSGCASHVGKINKVGQPIYLARGCRYIGTIMHEVGHALGFVHEQSRPDRDIYVRILYENIIEGLESNFQRYSSSLINTHGVPYDYTSLMHYGSKAFSKNGRDTIQVKEAYGRGTIGNSDFLSFNDIHLANLMYSCSDGCEKKTCEGGFLGKDCRCWCRGPNIDNYLVYCGTNDPVRLVPGNRRRTDTYPSNCVVWADRGYCTVYQFVRTHCKKSCA